MDPWQAVWSLLIWCDWPLLSPLLCIGGSNHLKMGNVLLQMCFVSGGSLWGIRQHLCSWLGKLPSKLSLTDPLSLESHGGRLKVNWVTDAFPIVWLQVQDVLSSGSRIVYFATQLRKEKTQRPLKVDEVTGLDESTLRGLWGGGGADEWVIEALPWNERDHIHREI